MEFTRLEATGYEEVWRASDPAVNFLAFIALHNTRRGPALGGVRFWKYPNESEALADVLRLARSMTYKSAVANLPHGGGKGVILEPKAPYDRNQLYRRFAAFIDYLEGRYITAKDVGTHTSDLDCIAEETRWATGRSAERGGAGDPSPLTALGVKVGISSCVGAAFKKNDLSGLKIAIQGMGSVGAALAKLLAAEGCQIWGADVSAKKLTEMKTAAGVRPQFPELILSQDVDILAPCALGQVLDRHSIPQLKCKIVAGAANDQLADEESDAALLQERAILYAPDFVINAGGLIHVAMEWKGYDAALARQKTEGIGKTLREIFSIANEEKITTHHSAIRLAKSRLG